MILFLTPLLVSLAALGYAAYYFNKNFSDKAANIDVQAFSQRFKKATKAHIYKLYTTIAAASVLFGLILIFAPLLGFNVLVAFFAGVLLVIALSYLVLVFLINLNSRLADRTAHGLIDTFGNILNGASILGVVIVSSAVLGVSVYYIIFNPPSASALVAFALGTVVASVFIKLGVNVYLKEVPLQDKESSSQEKRDAKVIAQISAANLAKGVGSSIEIFETIVLVLIGSLLAASFYLSGLSGAFALPLLVIIAGLIANYASVKLAAVGSTTNITKNIVFTVLGSALLSAIFAFPLMVWALGNNLQYSIVQLWVPLVFGLFAASFLILFSYFRGNTKLNKNENIALIITLVALGLLAGYWIAGIYGIILYIWGVLAMVGVFIALSIFSYIIESVAKIAQITELPDERRNILSKMRDFAQNIETGIKNYSFSITILVSILFLVIYRQQIASNVVQFEISVANPNVLAGVLLGVASIFIAISRILSTQNKAYHKLKDKFDYSGFSGTITRSVIKVISLPILLLFVLPVLGALILGAQGFGGFMAGQILAVLILGAIHIFDTDIKNNYSGIVLVVIYSAVKTMLPVALLVSIFLI